MNQNVQTIGFMGDQKSAIVLRLFLDDPDTEISQKDVIRRAGVAKGTAIRALRTLVGLDFIGYKRIGVTHLYRLHRDNPVVKQMKILHTLLKLQGVRDINHDIEMYLYGSCARGEDTRESDIDLLIIGDIKREQLVSPIEKLSESVGKTINFTIFRQTEWAMLQKKDKPFYERVEKDKIRIR